MNENGRLTDRQRRREKLKAIAEAEDGKLLQDPRWKMRVRVVGDRLKIRVVAAEK